MSASRASPWQKEFDDFARAFSGAFLFGLPLLYTMEMWWIGSLAEPWKLLLMLGLALLVNTHLAYFAGFKKESTFRGSFHQAVDALAVGVVAAAAMLAALNRINFASSLEASLGRVIVQAVPLSVGASVANALLSLNGGGRAGEDKAEQQRREPWRALLNDIGATVAGGIFVGFSIAPTDEVPLLAHELDLVHEVALIGLSLLISYLVVFESGFSPQEAHHPHGLLQMPLTETVLAYVVSLGVSLIALYLFDRFEWGDPLPQVLSLALVLGLPTAIGGAAGRLVI